MSTKLAINDLTFGVELEMVNFKAPQPIMWTAQTLVRNDESGVVYTAEILQSEADWEANDDWNNPDVFQNVRLLEPNVFWTADDLGCNPPRPPQPAFSADQYRALRAETKAALETNEMPQIQLQNGSIPDPWSEFEDGGYREYTSDSNPHPLTGVGQAVGLLENADLDYWDVADEGSLAGCGFDAIEVISPVLKWTDEDHDEIHEVCSIFGPRASVDRECGLHIHVGLPDKEEFTVEQIKAILLHWLSIEPKLKFNPMIRLGGQSMPLGAQIWPARIEEARGQFDLFKAFGPGRNFAINVQSLKKFGTLEFRCFHPTLDANQVLECAKFVLDTVVQACA